MTPPSLLPLPVGSRSASSGSANSFLGFLLFCLAAAQPARASEEDPGEAAIPRMIDEHLEPPPALSCDFFEEGPPPPEQEQKAKPPMAFAQAVPSARQPEGALSGRIVYMTGGHGWVYAPDRWRLQRPNLHDMNEDYGNIDQLNFFATHCFNAGAIVVPFRPLGRQTNEVVIDNTSPQVTWAGSWSNSVSPIYYGEPGAIPYRYASLSATETATATYTPNIPEAGFYPVYTWVRHGLDRGHQLYRIRHTGGESQVRIPHHMVGNGWVYLGEYYFNAGSDSAAGSVIVSNLRGSPAGTYTFADAIRFGNGMGSIQRGGAVSGYPREDEGTRYWIQAGLGQGQSAVLYDGGGNDESDGWSAPPKMSREMNRQEEGNMFKRIYINFHSNAANGSARGALSLINQNAGMQTPNQSYLAELTGRVVNEHMRALGSPPLEIPWSNRTTYTFTGGYSEIDGSLFGQEMDATIIEVGFHDNESDARIMRDPKGRDAIAKASLHAVIRYMNHFDGAPLVFPPGPPLNSRATLGANNTSATLRWQAPVSSGGGGTPTGYVIYQSADGRGFGNPVVTGNVSQRTFTGLEPGVNYYFRIAAINAGGESLPGETVAVRLPVFPESPRVLIVNAYDRYDRSNNLRQFTTVQSWSRPGASGAIERVWPRQNNSFDYVETYGKAVAHFGYAFDSCQNEAVASGLQSLNPYDIVIWAAGQESTADESFSATEQTRIAAYRNAGGNLFVSGSEIAWDLARSSGPTAADRAFFANHLRAQFPGDAHDNSNSHTIHPLVGSIFAGRPSGSFDNGSMGINWVRTPDVITPNGTGARAALNYASGPAGAAAIQYDGSAGGGRVVYFGFPFETLPAETVRTRYMADILGFLNADRYFISAGSTWKYLNAGSAPPAGWTLPDFNDNTWQAGMAGFGYGGDGERTVLFGGPPQNRRPAAWFRHAFHVADPSNISALRVDYQRDDGLVLWLNGVEILRDNIHSGPLLPSTLATTSIEGDAETAWNSRIVSAAPLLPGSNILTAEVRQGALNSTDLGFDLKLSPSQQETLTYATWRENAFGSDFSDDTLAAPGEDPDKDGMVNLLEYALGSSPLSPSTVRLPTLEWHEGAPSLSFSRNAHAPDLVFAIEGSGDLESWTVLADNAGGGAIQPRAQGVTVTETQTGGMKHVIVRDTYQEEPDELPSYFLRLRVTN